MIQAFPLAEHPVLGLLICDDGAMHHPRGKIATDTYKTTVLDKSALDPDRPVRAMCRGCAEFQ